MTTNTTVRASLLGLTLLLEGGCEADARPALIWEGDHLRFGSDQPLDEISDANFEYADAYAGYLKRLLDAPNSLVVDFYWLPGEGERTPYCERDIVACTYGRTVYSSLVVDEHELVHAVGSYHGNAFIPIEEGLAEYLGDDADRLRPDISGSPADVMLEYAGAEAIPYSAYPLMGHFVSYVVGAHGLDSLMEYARASDPYESYGSTAERWDQAVELPLDVVLDDYASYPTCPPHLFRSDGFDCESRQPTPLREGIPLEISIGRNVAETLGPRYGEIWRTIALDLPITGHYRVQPSLRSGDPGDDVRIRISRCGTDCQDASDDPYHEPRIGITGTWCARAGRHTVRVSAAPETVDVLNLSIVPVPSAECE